MSYDYAEIEVDEVEMATEAAILVVISKEGRKVWIPRSVILDEYSDIQSDAQKGDSGAMAIKKWFALKEGLTT